MSASSGRNTSPSNTARHVNNRAQAAKASSAAIVERESIEVPYRNEQRNKATKEQGNMTERTTMSLLLFPCSLVRLFVY
jgi:hypothetical protein